MRDEKIAKRGAFYGDCTEFHRTSFFGPLKSVL